MHQDTCLIKLGESLEWSVRLFEGTYTLLTTVINKMSATLIVALFSLLSAASSGAHGSIFGMLQMLAAMR
jgi:membrane associated rhomboid family serine protease